MNSFAKKFFILFFIGLVLSITPCFAFKASDIFKNNDRDISGSNSIEEIDKKDDYYKSELYKHCKEFNDTNISGSNSSEEIDKKHEYYVSELYKHCKEFNDLLKFISFNLWMFQKFEENKKHIIRLVTVLVELKDLIFLAIGTQKVIKSDINKLDTLKNNPGDSKTDIEFLKEVERQTNTTLNITSPTNFKNGDIVQYQSEKGNNKYLEYLETDNKTNYVILQNSAHKKIVLTPEFFNKTAKLKIIPKKSDPLILKTIYDMQIEKINKTRKLAERNLVVANQYQKIGNENKEMGFSIFSVAFGVAWVSFVIGVTLYFLEIEPAIIITYAGITTGVFWFVTGLITYIHGNYQVNTGLSIAKDAREVLENANAFEFDLNEVNSFPFAANMNLTTTARGIVKGKLDGTDFNKNKLTYIIVEQPKNGKLNILPDGQFIYTPGNDFKGNESFKYKVNNGKLDSNIATVNIIALSATKIVMSNLKGKVGDKVNFKATVLNDQGTGIDNATVIFKLNDAVIGQAKTDAKGIAILNYQLKYKGKFTLLAIFLGNNLYATSNCTSIITIGPK